MSHDPPGQDSPGLLRRIVRPAARRLDGRVRTLGRQELESTASLHATMACDLETLQTELAAQAATTAALAVVAEERLARLVLAGRRLPRGLVDAYLAAARPTPCRRAASGR